MNAQTEFVLGEAAMLEYGAAMSKLMADDELVFLEGELGAGKTTRVLPLSGCTATASMVAAYSGDTSSSAKQSARRSARCRSRTFIHGFQSPRDRRMSAR